jgi:hypothetical protein
MVGVNGGGKVGVNSGAKVSLVRTFLAIFLKPDLISLSDADLDIPVCYVLCVLCVYVCCVE